MPQSLVIDDDSRGEIVHAHLVLEPGAEWNEDNWVQFCRKHLAAHKRPRRFTHCTTELPKELSGQGAPSQAP